MSWDISIQKFSVSYRSVSEIPEDAKSLDLGSQAAVQSAISEVFQGVDWSDPSLGYLSSSFGSIEFECGSEEPLTHIVLRVRASTEVVPLIIELCRRQGWSAIDGSTDEMLEQSDDPERGLIAWRAFRDRILGNLGQ